MKDQRRTRLQGANLPPSPAEYRRNDPRQLAEHLHRNRDSAVMLDARKGCSLKVIKRRRHARRWAACFSEAVEVLTRSYFKLKVAEDS